MDAVTIRCHAELNDFLPREQRHTTITVPCVGHESIKHLVESLGVPHPEVAALRVNGIWADFAYLVRPGDQFEVYPASLVGNAGHIPLRPPLAGCRFVLDTHLGRLAAYLRMLGFDTLYSNAYEDAELAQLAHDEGRVLLTRDIGLLKRSLVMHAYFVRDTRPTHQLREVVQRFHLHGTAETFHRCIRCNGLMQRVEKADILHLLAPKTQQFFDEFQQCQACAQIYWRGSHYIHMQQLAAHILNTSQPPASVGAGLQPAPTQDTAPG